MPVEFLKYTKKAGRPLIATPGSVGSDLFSAYKYVIKPFETILVKTDLVISIPQSCYGLVTGKSSVALKGVQTHVGMIDSDYVGLVCVVLTNFTKADFVIEEDDRIGQISILRYEKPAWVEVDKISNSPVERKGSFGSTGR